LRCVSDRTSHPDCTCIASNLALDRARYVDKITPFTRGESTRKAPPRSTVSYFNTEVGNRECLNWIP
ncbi:MAG: hypothetical protein AAB393_06565, partial [Bacteroidota bacterium]